MGNCSVGTVTLTDLGISDFSRMLGIFNGAGNNSPTPGWKSVKFWAAGVETFVIYFYVT